tara:strand:- start:108 stop:497 length:390 start_codon:yes stop_codon:yes gene_type:complete
MMTGISVWTIILLIPTIALVFFFIDYRKKRLSPNTYKDTEKFSQLEYLKYFLGLLILAVFGELLAPSLVSLSLLIQIIVMIALIVINIRRLHDINMSGWWAIVSIFPLSSVIMILICLFTPSSRVPTKQ